MFFNNEPLAMARFSPRSPIPVVLIILFVASLLPFAEAAKALANPPSMHHELTISLYPETQRLKGQDILKVSSKDGASLSFSLAPHARIISALVSGKESAFAFEEGRLRIPVESQAPQDEITVTISYEAFFRDAVPRDPVHTEDPSYGVIGVLSPEGTFLLPEAGWYPHLPESAPTFLLRVQGPEGYEAITSGRRLVRESAAGMTTSVWEITRPVRGLALSAGRYVAREKEVSGTLIHAYFFPEDDHLAEGYLKATAGYLRLYTDLFGPYPFEKFAVVENFFPTGYGFPSYTLLGQSVVRLPFIVETSLGHEVAHAWWGNGVFVDHEQGNWSEGLTTYVADYLYKERASPEEAREYRLKILRDYASLVPPEEDFALAAFTGRMSPLTRAVGYGKSAMLFHMARRLVGDEAFWEGLRRVFQEKCFRKASWDDFALALGRAGGLNLRPFFRQWVNRPGAPNLALEAVEAKQQDQGWQISGRLTQQAPYYDLEIPIRLETDAANIEIKVSLTDQASAFTLISKASPQRLVVDPDVDLFRRLDPVEIPPTVNSVKGARSLVAVVANGLPKEVEEASTVLLEALGQGQAPRVREKKISVADVQGHDVLYLGVPEGEGYLPTLPKGLSLEPKSFALEGVTYSAPEDVLFVMLPHLSESDRVAGLFLPLSAAAASSAARKIPHYGKYSYLAFRDGINEAKGTWPVQQSPLIHLFSF